MHHLRLPGNGKKWHRGKLSRLQKPRTVGASVRQLVTGKSVFLINCLPVVSLSTLRCGQNRIRFTPPPDNVPLLLRPFKRFLPSALEIQTRPRDRPGIWSNGLRDHYHLCSCHSGLLASSFPREHSTPTLFHSGPSTCDTICRDYSFPWVLRNAPWKTPWYIQVSVWTSPPRRGPLSRLLSY